MTNDSTSPIRAVRVYLRVSTDGHDLARQEAIVAGARAAGYYVAAVYREKASGTRPDRPELLRMVADLQPGEVVVAEEIDRISRLALAKAELLVATIRAKGARLAVPGIVDLSEVVADSAGVAQRAGSGAGHAAAPCPPDRARRLRHPARASARGDRDRQAGRAVQRSQAEPRLAQAHHALARDRHEQLAHGQVGGVQHRVGQARYGAAAVETDDRGPST
jgi:hypothetical protein